MTLAKLEQVGAGPTDDLSLRVSVAALARVVFPHPDDGTRMLALEHKATLARPPRPPEVTIKAQPFGGAVRLLNIDRFLSFVGDFTFDSKRSRSEGDLRVFIRPSRLDAVHKFCLSDASRRAGSDLETDPSRELKEELEDALGFQPGPQSYAMQRIGIVLENQPTPTSNARSAGQLTARIYWVYEVRILDVALCRSLLASSQSNSVEVLHQMALDRYRRGEPGWATAALVLPIHQIREAYLATSPEDRGQPLLFQNMMLAANVPAVLEGVDTPKYQWMD